MYFNFALFLFSFLCFTSFSQNIWIPYLKNDSRKLEIYFKINDKIYLGETNNFGEYDDYNDTILVKKSPLANDQIVQYNFTIQNLGYIITNKNLYSYSPILDSWELLLQNIPINPGGVVEVINGKAVFFSSINYGNYDSCESYTKEVWEFNPNNGNFKKQNDLPITPKGFSGGNPNCMNSILTSIAFNNRIFILSNYIDNWDPGSVVIEYLPESGNSIIHSKIPPSSNFNTGTLFVNKNKLYAFFENGLGGLGLWELNGNNWNNVSASFDLVGNAGYLVGKIPQYFQSTNIPQPEWYQKNTRPAIFNKLKNKYFNNAKTYSSENDYYLDFEEIIFPKTKCINVNQGLELKFKLDNYGIKDLNNLVLQISDSTGKYLTGKNIYYLGVDSISIKPRRNMRNDIIYGGSFNYYMKSILTKSITVSPEFFKKGFRFRITSVTEDFFSSSRNINKLFIYNPAKPITKSFEGLFVNKKDPVKLDTICYGMEKNFVIDDFNSNDVWEKDGSFYENPKSCKKVGGITLCLYKGGNTSSLKITESGSYRINRTVDGCTSYGEAFSISTIATPVSPFGDLQFFGKNLLANLTDSVKIVSSSNSLIEYVWSFNNRVVKKSDDAFLIAKIPGNYTGIAKFKNTGTFVCGIGQTLLVNCTSCIPLNFKYSTPQKLLRDQFITEIIPSITTTLDTKFSINPQLPTGLLFDVNTGVISGKPIVSISEKIYTITATNSFGTTATTISISVERLNNLPQIITDRIIVSNFDKGPKNIPISFFDQDNDILTYELLNYNSIFSINNKGELLLISDLSSTILLDYLDIKVFDGVGYSQKRLPIYYCEQVSNISGVVVSNKVFNSNNYLKSTQNLKNNSKVSLNAQNFIILDSGFNAEKGVVFEVKAGLGCPN
jgi:hypothetical protein